MNKIFYNNFDILRLSLSILVFFGHWNLLTQQNIENHIFHLSGYAVDMFFIVSGFLIYLSYTNDSNNKNFYIKRFFRIYPLYLLLVLLQTLFFLVFSNGDYYEIMKYFFSNVIFLNFLAPTVGDTFNSFYINAINGSLWTLKNEVIFYILVPFIYFFHEKFGVKFLILLYSSSVIYLIGVDYIGFNVLAVQFPAQLRLFLTGVFLYVLFNKLIELKNNWLYLSSALLIFFLINLPYFKYIVYPLILGLVTFFLTYHTRKVKINFDFSYSFYIIHFPIIQIFLYFDINFATPLFSFLTLFFVTLVLSYFSERYIEKRFIAIGKTLVKK